MHSDERREKRMKVKELKLCGRCEAFYRERFEVREVRHSVNEKVTCDHCGRRRYGATFEIKEKEL